jgi:hypothetical protein
VLHQDGAHCVCDRSMEPGLGGDLG